MVKVQAHVALAKTNALPQSQGKGLQQIRYLRSVILNYDCLEATAG